MNNEKKQLKLFRVSFKHTNEYELEVIASSKVRAIAEASLEIENKDNDALFDENWVDTSGFIHTKTEELCEWEE